MGSTTHRLATRPGCTVADPASEHTSVRARDRRRPQGATWTRPLPHGA
ncbi:hypothetical protein [Halovenus salina]|nr:hypothetical protein [Halovenus salina]